MSEKHKDNQQVYKPNLGQRVLIPKSQHKINPTKVDNRALEVIKTLRNAGYDAYVVGGAVRDMLLDLPAKDFDVATNATPEQVKELFRRSFIIGRRFRIVHVVYGRGRGQDIVEVSTFRAYVDMSAIETVKGNEKSAKAQLADKKLAMNESGRVLRDNVWGSHQEDAARRDFTINAMYYDPLEEVIVDYHQGFEDAQKRVLKIIGDAATRYREDPVRILRVVRFAAKLSQRGFEIDPKTREPIQKCLPLLAGIPPSRMFDEMVKFLQTGHAQASIKALYAQGLQKVFPMLDDVINDVGENAGTPKAHMLEWLMFADTDGRLAQGKSVVPSFMLSCLLWPEVKKRWDAAIAKGEHAVPALQSAINAAFDLRVGDVSGRGRLGADMREIWLIQPRFERRTGVSPYNLVNQPRFRAAFDFMCLRAEAGEYSAEISHWWEVFSSGDESIKLELIQQVQAERKKEKASKKAEKPLETAPPAKKSRARRRRRNKKEANPVVQSQETKARRCSFLARVEYKNMADQYSDEDADENTANSTQLADAWIGLGANLGDALETLKKVIERFKNEEGLQLLKTSSFYKTAPVDAQGPDFINAVVHIQTSYTPLELLHLLQKIEIEHGRKRPYKNAPRTLDLDLLLYADVVMQEHDLTLPHPAMHKRAFVLVPLAELDECLNIPQQGRVKELLTVLADQKIERIECAV